MQGCFPFHCYFEVHNFKSIIDVKFLLKKIMIIQRQFSIQNALHVKKKKYLKYCKQLKQRTIYREAAHVDSSSTVHVYHEM